MNTLLLVVGLVLVGACLVNFTAVKRMFAYFAGQLSNLGRWFKDRDPLTVMKNRSESGTQMIANARLNLGKAGGEVRSSNRAVAAAQEEVDRLNNRIQTAKDAGDPNNTLTGYALQLADAEDKLQKAKDKLSRDQARFDNFSTQVEEGRRLVEEARKEARELGLELEQSEQEKEMNEFANQFDPTSFAADDSYNEAREAVKRKIDQNRGMADADAAINKQRANEAKDRDLERQAKAKEILSRFDK